MAMVPSFWSTVPRKSIVLFLLGVFFIFSAMGFASDLTDLGWHGQASDDQSLLLIRRRGGSG